MLKELSIKNFTSFNCDTLFSMEADTKRVGEHQGHVVSISDNSILKVVSIYGPNGGGKTNVINSVYLSKLLQSNMSNRDGFELPCIFSDSSTIEETQFFVDEEYEIGYRFCVTPTADDDIETVDNRATNRYRTRQLFDILSEEVSYRKSGEADYILLFTRDKSGLVVSDFFDEIKGNNELRLAKGQTAVKYLFDTFANRESDLSEDLDVIKHLYRQIDNIVYLENSHQLYYFIGNRSQLRIVNEFKNELINLLNKFDIKIKDIRVYENRSSSIYFVRELDIDGQKVEKELSLIMESDGTQKVFYMLLMILRNIKEGKIFCCDDMNAYLHPKMLRVIVQLFQDNNYHSQLIFNSHDIINMDNELFRRDEIWFAYRDDEYSTQLLPLSNIVNYKGEPVRKDAKYFKQYLEGKYGADPFIKRGLSWDE